MSSVGYFDGNDNPQYSFQWQGQVANSLDTQLFRTARISASSLRYYGLGLENGNYNISLQFAELSIRNSNWESLGRRVFDIYIQVKKPLIKDHLHYS